MRKSFVVRNATVLLVGGWSVAACFGAPPQSTQPQSTQPASAEHWQLVWSDEFDAPGAPDPSKWGYEVGLVRNHEPQYYTRDRRENARVENGYLVIEGRKEKYPVATAGDPSAEPAADYTSASLITLGKAEFKYGRFVARAKVTGSRGTWPAFWMLGVDRAKVHWPACGEIDTMEFFSQRPTKVKGSVLFVNKLGKFQSVSKDFVPAVRPSDDFHTYECRWYPDRVDLYVDDVKYNTMHIDDAAPGDANPFRKPMYLLLNLALGSSTGKIDESKLPAKYLIDYVRVYQLKP